MYRFVLAVFLGCCTAVLATGLPTSQTAIVGNFARGPVDFAVEVNQAEFLAIFGSSQPEELASESQAQQFFRNGGGKLFVVRVDPARPLGEALVGSINPTTLRGLGALLPLSELGLLVCPELTTLTELDRGACLQMLAVLGESRPLLTLLDPPPGVTTAAAMVAWRQASFPAPRSDVAIYFPEILVDPATWDGGTSEIQISMGSSGSIAAVIAQQDEARGIWKAPAGSSAVFQAEGLTTNLSIADREALNPVGVNSLVNSSGALTIWGARTLAPGTEDQYIAVARTRRWIAHSLQRELSDAALEQNDPALWANLRQRTATFLHPLYQVGALLGTRQEDAYFVRCDSTTTTAADVAAHRVNVQIGIALVRSAEFLVAVITLDTLDPARPLPSMSLLISPPVAGTVILAYPSAPGFQHTLLSSQSMAAGSWFDPGSQPGNGGWFRERAPILGDKRFFRVETQSAW